MFQRLTAQLPDWARPTHPLLRQELNPSQPLPSRRVRLLRALSYVVVLLLLLAGGVLIATGLGQQEAGQNPLEGGHAILYWPLIVIQVGMQIGALMLTANTVSAERMRQTWDNLRATEKGAELAMQTRWAAVFYRLRGVMAIVLLFRVAFVIGILVDLTAFQGHYLDLLTNGIIPSVPLAVSAVLLAVFMTAGLLIPITGVGMDAAVGLLVSTVFQQRTYSFIAQGLLIVIRIALVGGLLLSAAQFKQGDLAVTDAGAWILMFGLATVGDWGLAFLLLSVYGEIWATVSYGILLGPALLGFVLLQAAAGDLILKLAARRAELSG